MKKMQILSKLVAQDTVYPPRTIIISITSPEGGYAEFKHEENVLDILRLRFHDVESNMGVYKPMSEAQAREVALFIQKYIKEAENIVVHCEAGISRSSGTAMAIYEYLGGDIGDIADSPRYYPNRTCYKLVSNELKKLPIDKGN